MARSFTWLQIVVSTLTAIIVVLAATSKKLHTWPGDLTAHQSRVPLHTPAHVSGDSALPPPDRAVARYQHRASAGLDIRAIASMTGVIAVANTYNTNDHGVDMRTRCADSGGRGLYIVWDLQQGTPHVCYCLSGMEHCSDPLLSSGDARLNCVSGIGAWGNCMMCDKNGGLC